MKREDVVKNTVVVLTKDSREYRLLAPLPGDVVMRAMSPEMESFYLVRIRGRRIAMESSS
jgi:hypothetical protein